MSEASDETVRVKVMSHGASATVGTCGHGRPVAWNLAIGYLRHRDDGTDCTAPTRDLRHE